MTIGHYEDKSLCKGEIPELRQCFLVASFMGYRTSQAREDALFEYFGREDIPDSDKVFSNLTRLFPLEEYERPFYSYGRGATIFALALTPVMLGNEEYFEAEVSRFKLYNNGLTLLEGDGSKELENLELFYSKPHCPYYFKQFDTLDEARSFVDSYVIETGEERERKARNADIATSELKEMDDYELSQALVYAKYTEGGAAERFVALHGKDLKYDNYDKGRWLIWNGSYWRPDDTRQVKRLYMDLVNELYLLEKEMPGGSDKKMSIKRALKAFAKKCDSNHSMNNVLSLAATYEGISIYGPEVLDKDKNIVGLPGEHGEVLDLETCKVCPALPEDCVTTTLGFYPADTEDCPHFKQFISRACGGSAGLISFIKKAMGYSLTGDPKEHIFFVLWGPGRNGKSTFLGIMREVFGGYGRHADMTSWQHNSKKEGQTRSDLVRLEKARFVDSIEAERKFRFNMTVIQGVTGGDPLTLRDLFGKEFQYNPMFSLWVAVNYRPEITEKTVAAWERVIPIPWTVFIPKDERDKDLPKKLIAEGPGILRWVLNGLIDYREEGLNNLPPEVMELLGKYKEENDSVALFCKDMIVLEKEAITGAGDLYIHYSTYCEQEGLKPVDKNDFPEDLKALQLPDVEKLSRSHAGHRWKGLRLKTQGDFALEEIAKNQKQAA